MARLKRLGLLIAGEALRPSQSWPIRCRSMRAIAAPDAPVRRRKANDEAAKPDVMQRQRGLLDQLYDLGDRAIPGQMMSGGRKPVRVRRA